VKRAWLGVALLAALIGFAVWESRYVGGVLTEIAVALDECERCVDAAAWPQAETFAQDALRRWDGASDLLSLLMHEKELEAGRLLLARAEAAVRLRARTEFKLEHAAARLWLRQKTVGVQPNLTHLLWGPYYVADSI
jgi:hypothetical protein